MSESITLDICDAMRAAIEAHAWDTTVPRVVVDGPISSGWLDFPCIGVMAGDAVGNVEQNTVAYADTTEEFIWAVAQVQDLTDLASQWRAHIQWRSEAIRLARKAVDNYWGLSSGIGQIRSSVVTGWEASMVATPTSQTTVRRIINTSIRMEVSYRERYQ